MRCSPRRATARGAVVQSSVVAAQYRGGAKLLAPSDDIWLRYKGGSAAGGSTALWTEPSHDVLRDEVSAHGCTAGANACIGCFSCWTWLVVEPTHRCVLPWHLFSAVVSFLLTRRWNLLGQNRRQLDHRLDKGSMWSRVRVLQLVHWMQSA